MEIWKPLAKRSGDHRGMKIRESPGKVSSSRTEAWKMPTLEGQQRGMTQQRDRGEKETGKTRTECYLRHREEVL